MHYTHSVHTNKLICKYTGAALFCSGPSYSVILNTVFLGNRASYHGGAIYAENECNFTCQWCTFDANSVSKRGGAVYLTNNSDAYFESTAFTYNYV